MTVTFAVFGDIHGRQDAMYEYALSWEKRNRKKLDAILQVGDFETIRHEEDLGSFFAPARYQFVKDFAGYYTGSKKAPIFTVFIGGNHEAWKSLEKHRQGGFVVPNIYYLGRSGVVCISGINVGGLTGIYNSHAYKKPLTPENFKSWKYYREEDVAKLKGKDVDILLLHEWLVPTPDLEVLAGEIPESLRSATPTPANDLVLSLKPKRVFMGHMHRPYLDARMKDSEIYGLKEFNTTADPNSMKVIEI